MTRVKGNNISYNKNNNAIRSREYINTQDQIVRLTDLQSIVLNRLKDGPLTTMEGVEELGTTSLSARIYELRKNGFTITSKMVKIRTRYGRVCLIAEYSLIQKREN